ncbi:ABC transporter ATP-binding protein [Halovivax limisalsi]|uniref:ABC transporter ATP-binding protein n=1 Tax=Halovivax limisalsi TaxID=1453760 RepID=UPI001FFC6E4A|nr:ABC transporter ATP-binding protein [Halovivax limisalsi]
MSEPLHHRETDRTDSEPPAEDPDRPDGRAAAETGDRQPSDADGTGTASQLVGDSLALGYPSTDEPIVEVERIDLPAGEVTALVGPNGSGKSTLLRALARQLEPEAGEVLFDDTDVRSFGNKEFARHVGLLSQERDSPGSISVEELLDHGRYPYRGFFEGPDDADRAAIERAIERVGIEHLRSADLDSLSGGQKQLVWVAMVLAQETDVLLLDEPTTYLDLHHQLRVLDVVERLSADHDVTVGIVLHDIGQAARYADNLVALKEGSVYDWGPPDEVVTDVLLEEVFGVVASVGYGESGPTILPHRAVEE